MFRLYLLMCFTEMSYAQRDLTLSGSCETRDVINIILK